MKDIMKVSFVLVAGLVLAFSALGAAEGGRFSVLTYNVAGLPEGISSSHPVIFNKQISPLLNDFDLVLAQEDFYYHEDLSSASRHPYVASPGTDGILGDGLGRFSIFPMSEVTRVAWEECHGTLGYANDCLTPKGFSVASHELAPGVFVDVYNLHMDAGGAKGDIDARDAQAAQLSRVMTELSKGRAVIVAGDFNLNGKRPRDLEILGRLMEEQGLSDVCRSLDAGCKERIDRILFRSGAGVTLSAAAYKVEEERFVNELGLPLSDHEAVSAVFEWQRTNE